MKDKKNGRGDEGLAVDLMLDDDDETPADALIFDDEGNLVSSADPFIRLKRAKGGKPTP